MVREFLDFEKELLPIHKKIRSMLEVTNPSSKNIKKLNQLEAEYKSQQKQIFNKLSPWQILQLARHPNRPHGKDFIDNIFTDFDQLHGDRVKNDCLAIYSGIGRIDGIPVMVLGQNKGRELTAKIKNNWGMMSPEGFRKAYRLFEMAEKFNLPVITFIDTPGAYPGVDAESNNQSQAIAQNLSLLSSLRVPVINIIIGEGCSGGALGIGVGDKLHMLSYSTFSVISPEGCASILWRDAKKASKAAEAMEMTAPNLLKLNIIDSIIDEPLGGAHDDWSATFQNVKNTLLNDIQLLKEFNIDDLLTNRYQKLMNNNIGTESLLST